MKLQLTALALSLLLAPAIAQEAATAPAKVAASAIPLEVTPVVVAPTDISEFLDIQSWRFKIRIPNATSQTLLNRRLELRMPGQNPILIASDSDALRDFKAVELSLMMMPDGEELTQAPRLRIFRKIQFIDNVEQKASAYTSNKFLENPLKKWNVSSYSSRFDAPPEADGSIVLMNFDVESLAEQKTVKGQLVWVVTATLPTSDG